MPTVCCLSEGAETAFGFRAMACQCSLVNTTHSRVGNNKATLLPMGDTTVVLCRFFYPAARCQYQCLSERDMWQLKGAFVCHERDRHLVTGGRNTKHRHFPYRGTVFRN